METIFSKILRGEIPTQFLYEDDTVVAFADIHPVAPVHILIIPRKPIVSIATMTDADVPTVGHMFQVARDIAAGLTNLEKGYKLVIRVGEHGGQEVQHLHLHLIGGGPLHEEIRLK